MTHASRLVRAFFGVAVATALLTGCKSSQGGGDRDAGQGAFGDEGGAFWSCGESAGVCSCIPIRVDPGPVAHECGASPCCFAQGSICTCRMSGAALDCADLRAALDAGPAVDRCPPASTR